MQTVAGGCGTARAPIFLEHSMGGASPFVKTFLILILLLLLVGFYFLIDAMSVAKQALEAQATELSRLRQDLARLSDRIGDGVAAGDGEAPGRQGAEEAWPEFANLQVRDPEAVEGGGLVLAASSQAGSLNYILANEAQVGNYWDLANDTLGVRNLIDPNVWEPVLAERWEISDDGLTFTIYLRKGVLWHDVTDPVTGERFNNVEVTAPDFKFYVDVIRNPKIPCEHMRNYYIDLDRIEIVDDYTFKVIWKKPYFRAIDFTLGLMPLPRHFYRFDPENPEPGFVQNHKRNEMIVGCGRWIFERWERGVEIVFRRNERYYGPKPYLKRMQFRIIREPTAQLQALRNGQVDRTGLTAEQWEFQTVDESFKERFARFKYPRRAYFYIGYNMRRAPFDDRRVRLALTHLMDRQRVIDDVLLGHARVVTGPFLPESPYSDPAIDPWPFDIDAAVKLLEEAGWIDADGDGIREKDGEPLTVSILISAGSKTFARVAEIWSEDCAKAGLIVNINPIEWSVLMERTDEWNFDAVMSGWSMPWESDPYQLWHGSQASIKKSSNYVGFDHPEANRIIETARSVFDLEERAGLYRRFHEILHEEQPYTFLFNPQALVAQHRRFRNARVYTLGMDPSSFWVPLPEQKYRD
jgi:peptide/nickel transport system substrate-binding protein